ncbi:PDZ domain-containing protein [Blastopirellula sp. JC732]|uniref:PDZ domain-containing protein n=1 Tax=Blastopirellula sediminis TaxID=2894196 RepID=A0A9X1MHB6_9BACT|nr:PDZ domain-containing protein [Blastopirellula sediminis]MCC9608124.1 PDZ domain-containing protein [Blastopirellula sediminis]MCC9627083.1 PDZ domain-containing protein [Blastopirellula sediminis]
MRARITILSLLLLALGVLRGLDAAEPKTLLCSKAASDGDFVTLPVEIGDERFVFVVDTGCVTSLFDKSLEAKLTVHDEAILPKEVLPGRFSVQFRPPAMNVLGTEEGSLPFPAESSLVRCIDLSDVSEACDQPIAGILGMDFLSRYVLQLNLSEGEIRLLENVSFTGVEHDAVVDLVMYTRRPFAVVWAGDIPFPALVDTGAIGATLYLTPKHYEYLRERERLLLLPLKHLVDGETQIHGEEPALIPVFQLGPFKHYGVQANGDDDLALLGLPYFLRYKATFDFSGRRLYLQKSPHFEMVDESFHSGIYLRVEEAVERRAFVEVICSGTYADKNGVQIGDRLLSINDVSIAKMSQCHITRRLSQRRFGDCRLELERDGEKFVVTLPKVGDQTPPKMEEEGEEETPADGQ